MRFHSLTFSKVLRVLRRLVLSLVINSLALTVLCITYPIRSFRIKTYLSSQPNPKIVLLAFFGRGLGDCIYFSGLLMSIRKKFPSARIRLAILSQMKDYFSGNPFVDEILPCPDYFNGSFREYIRYFSSARNVGPVDILLELCPNLLLAPGVWSWIVPKRLSIGIGDSLKRIFYDKPVPIEWQKPFFEAMLPGLEPFAIKVNEMSFWIPQDAQIDELFEFRAPYKKAIVIAPGGKRNVEAPKDYCWTFKGFSSVTNRLIAEGHWVMLVGAEYDRVSIHGIESSHRLLNLIGKTSIRQLFVIIQRYARLVVCNNSGLLHVASVLNIPTVSYADPQENILRWGPYPPFGHHSILQDQPNHKVSPEELFQAILNSLKSNTNCDSTTKKGTIDVSDHQRP